MSWNTFVYNNIEKKLIEEGFPPSVAQGGAAHGADYYRRMSQASRKGMAFDDCLARARQFATAGCTKEEKPPKQPKSRKPKAVRTALI